MVTQRVTLANFRSFNKIKMSFKLKLRLGPSQLEESDTMNLNGGVGITTERHCPGNGLTPVGRQANLWRARPRTRRASDSDKPNRSKPDTSHPIASTEVQEHRRRGAAAPARSLIYWKAGTTGGPTMKNHGRRLRHTAGSGGGGSHPASRNVGRRRHSRPCCCPPPQQECRLLTRAAAAAP